MAFRNFKSARNIAIFVAILLGCFLLPSSVRTFTEKAFEEFRAPIDVAPSHISDLQKYWNLRSNSKRELIELGRDLARLNSTYELKVLENDSLLQQVKRLEGFLQLPSQEKYKMEVARVVKRDINAWWQKLTLRKGSIHGIKKGYAVIYGGGVVGRVSSVSLYTCQVDLVGSRDFRIACHIKGDDRPIIYQGLGGVSMKSLGGEIKDVPSDVDEKSGAVIVTSSLAGSFPDGILIGEISSLKLDSDEIFKSGTVRLNPELASIKEAAVLIPVQDVK